MGLVADSQLHKSNIKWPFSLLNPCHSHRRVMVVQTSELAKILLIYYIISVRLSIWFCLSFHTLFRRHTKRNNK